MILFRMAVCAAALCAAQPSFAASVTLDWAGGTVHNAATDITTISTVYNTWPTTALGLWKGQGYEVMLLGEFAFFDSFLPIDGPGFIASNDPGVVQATIEHVITRTNGAAFNLDEVHAQVGYNDAYIQYSYDSAPGSPPAFEFDRVVAAGFDVSLQSNTGTTLHDPHEYPVTGPFSTAAPQTFDKGQFGGNHQNVNFLSVKGATRDSFPCDPRYLSQAGPLVQANINCSDPSTFGQTSVSQVLADGSSIDAVYFLDQTFQNWSWNFRYTPTLSHDMDMAAIPVPGSAGLILLGLVGLGLARARHGKSRA